MIEFQLNQIHKRGPDGEFMERFTISADTDDLSALIDAVNLAIRQEYESQLPGYKMGAAYSINSLLHKYDYECITVDTNWFQHTFTPKPLFSLQHHGIFLDDIITDD